MAIYGNRQLSVFFIPIVEIRAKGFIFKRKQYDWSGVRRIEVWDEARWPWGVGIAIRVPAARITLHDGRAICIRDVGFEKKGGALMDGYSSAFDEFIRTFKENTKRRTDVNAVHDGERL